MHSSLTLKGTVFSPPRFCAPMAGVTHSAFRRLLSEFGGYGALFTEMLAGRALLGECVGRSPYTRRRPEEGRVIYQLLLRDADRLSEMVERLKPCEPAGLDLNCACPAPDARFQKAGGELFEDPVRLSAILTGLRAVWAGPLSVKIRLGKNTPGWEERLAQRLRLFEECGVDAVIVHPRFFDEKLKRSSRLNLLPWLVTLTRLPLVASGDIAGPATVAAHPDWFAGVAGIMIGRMAVARPWLFADWDQPPRSPDYREVWFRLCAYVCEDFPPEKAFLRMKQFTAYYARNFAFGQQLAAASQSAPDLETQRDRAARFFDSPQPIVSQPDFSGV